MTIAKTLRSAILLLGILGLTGMAGAADQIIYDNALENGWNDWSWATVNLANTTPTHSGSDSISVSAAQWDAVYLEHADFDTTPYTNLTFWINGGPTGGQTLQVAALLATVPQPVVTIGPLAPNTWQQITITLAALGAANQTTMDGIYITEAGAGQPTFYLDDITLTAVPATPPPSTVNLTVNAAQPVRTVDPRHFGVNTAMSDSVFDTDTTKTLLTDMGNQALRFPGGLGADIYLWSSNTSPGSSVPWMTSFDMFADVATNTHAQVFITVNYGSSTADDAAAWVAYSKTHGYGFKYWEVGNENYGSWETDNYPSANGPNDPVVYATRFQTYFNQMKAQDPTIKVGVPVIVGEDSYNLYAPNAVTNPRTGQSHYGWTPVLLANLKRLGVTPDFIDYHRYPFEPGSENDAALLQSSGTWSNNAADLRQQLTDYLGGAGAGVEINCTENNSVSYNPGKQSTSLVNGLFLADSLCSAMQTEFNSVLWWALRNYQDNSQNNSDALYGWRQYGDYGMVDNADPVAPADFYPAFYVFKLMKHFARGGDQIVSATSDYNLLATYAAKRTDGSLALLAINKSPATTLTGNFTLTGFTPTPNATVYSYGIPQDTAAQTGVGSADVAQTTFSSAGTSFAYNFPPYSVTVLSLQESIVANFTATPTSGNAPLPVTFTDTSTGTITNRFWNFGDGTTSTSLATSVQHTYTTARTNTVQLIVSGPAGVSTNTQSNYIVVTTPSPVATPLITPHGGTFTNMAKFTLSCATKGATIRYIVTTIGPAGNSLLYKNTAITLTESCTVQAQAGKTIGPRLVTSAVATAHFTIIPPPPLTITTGSLPAGVVKVKYTKTLAVTGGTAPFKWSLAAGKLPAGLTLNPTTGVITGTPTKTGTANFTVEVTDTSAIRQLCKLALTLTVNKTAP